MNAFSSDSSSGASFISLASFFSSTAFSSASFFPPKSPLGSPSICASSCFLIAMSFSKLAILSALALGPLAGSSAKWCSANASALA